MKNFAKIIATILTAALVFCTFPMAAFASGALTLENIRVEILNDTNTVSEIGIKYCADGNYLFLPSNISLNEFTLKFDTESGATTTIKPNGVYGLNKKLGISSGKPFDLTSLYKETPSSSLYAVTLEVTKGSRSNSFNFNVITSSTNAFFINIDESRGTISDMNNDYDHNTYCYGDNVYTVDDTNTIEELGSFNFRGRGNATWHSMLKRGYQIKFDSKSKPLGMKKAKTFVLLSNYDDTSLIRNALAFKMSDELEFGFTTDYEFADVYFNGDYRGLYMISEKNQIDKNRLDITDLEETVSDEIDAANTALSTSYKTVNDLYNAGIATFNEDCSLMNIAYTYEGIVTDEATIVQTSGIINYSKDIDMTGGYLVEYDNYEDVIQHIIPDGERCTYHSPEFGTDSTDIGYTYINNYLDDASNAVMSDSGYNDKGIYYTDYFNLEELAKLYIMRDYCMDWDATANYYMYKDASGKLCGGPVWDFDNSFGRVFSVRYTSYYYRVVENGGYIGKTNTVLSHLANHPEFCETVEKVYEKYSYIFRDAFMENYTNKLENDLANSIVMDHSFWDQKYDSDVFDSIRKMEHLREYYGETFLNNMYGVYFGNAISSSKETYINSMQYNKYTKGTSSMSLSSKGNLGYISGFNNGGTIEFKLNIEDAGTYCLNLSHSLYLSSDTTYEMDFAIDGGEKTAATVRRTTSSSSKSVTADSGDIILALPSGVHTLSVTVPGSTSEYVYGIKFKPLSLTCNHNYTVTEIIAPTCDTNGYITSLCSICGNTKTVRIKGGHSLGEAIMETAATCTEKGLKRYTCKNEGCTLNYTVKIQPTGHDYISEQLNSCGLTKYTCKNCGDTYEKYISKTSYKGNLTKYDINSYLTDNSLEDYWGWVGYKEKADGNEQIGGDNQIIVNTVRDVMCIGSNTANSSSLATYSLESQSGIQNNLFPFILQYFEPEDVLNRSADNYVMSFSGEYTRSYNAKQHLDDRSIDNMKASSLGNTGLFIRDDRNSGSTGYSYMKVSTDIVNTAYVVIDLQKDYDLSQIKFLANSKTSYGNTNIYARMSDNYNELYYARDGKNYITGELAGTSYSNEVTFKDSASELGYSLVSTLDSSTNSVVSCDTENLSGRYLELTFTRENSSGTSGSWYSNQNRLMGIWLYGTESTAKISHKYDSGVITKAPTCTSTGVITYTCQKCGSTIEETISMIEHTVEKPIITKKPTCTEDGVARGVCTVCGKTIDTYIPSLGHTSIIKTITTENGYKYTATTCSVCGKIIDKSGATLDGDGLYSGGTGASNDPYIISCPADFKYFTEQFTTSGYGKGIYFKQITDLDMRGISGYEGTNASGSNSLAFYGIYDGDGHTITVDITSHQANVSIFPYIYGAIMNVTFDGKINHTGDYLQPIRTIKAGAVVINCSSRLNLSGTGTVNGLCQSLYGTVANFYNEATINGKTNTFASTVSGGKAYNCYYSFNNPLGKEIAENPTSATLLDDKASAIALLNDANTNCSEGIAALELLCTDYKFKEWSQNSNGQLQMESIPLCTLTGHAYVNGECLGCSHVMHGDANYDSIMNIKDVVYLSRSLAKYSGYSTSEGRADMNGDGKITLYDLVFLSRAVAEWDGYKVS